MKSTREPMTVQIVGGEEGYTFTRPNVRVRPAGPGQDVLGICALACLWIVIVVLIFS